MQEHRHAFFFFSHGSGVFVQVKRGVAFLIVGFNSKIFFWSWWWVVKTVLIRPCAITGAAKFYPARGPSDTLARVITERMKTALGQSVIIENVTGAGGSIGTRPRRALDARRLTRWRWDISRRTSSMPRRRTCNTTS